ncbi:hypothetical protein PX699_13525 [Sphingobium sp. H39-3-25]|uniref:hypothetical protein n=1 Tax=Sphingobium arseniciresistens TaxID=3030834 RepID=UPI0023B8FC08|nr:hypothetical protein [Sphingobium arseniciresistens]
MLPNQKEPRERCAQWLRANRWTPEEMNRAMRSVGHAMPPTGAALHRWLDQRELLSRAQLRDLTGFMDRYPRIKGSADAFAEAAIIARREKLTRQREELAARKIATVAQREAYRTAWLAREHSPKRRDLGPMFGLDKATVTALRGY